MAEKRDHRQEVTDEIIRLIEAGTPPWRKTWDTGYLGLPVNAKSNKPYQGGNVLSLLCATVKRGYGDNRWMTYKQASESGYQVRKGEHSTHVEYWQFVPIVNSDGEAVGTDEKYRPLHKVYSVFNAQQIDGVPAIEPVEKTEFQKIETAEALLSLSGATIEHDGFDRAYYQPATDSIHLPEPVSFATPPEYYGTALHELTPWPGHTSRLNRNASCNKATKEYAFEELIAELASSFLTAETGIETDLGNSAAYLQSWLRNLKEDKHAIFKAAAAASKAADYILHPA
jgi:antirestriction protein ArdC